jgi:hypothetical protein
MLSRQVVTAAFIVGLLVAAPAAAQRQRNPGGGGVGAPRGGQPSRQAAAPQDRGGRPAGGRSYEPARPSAPPQTASRSPEQSRSGPGRSAVPREQAYGGGTYAAPRYGTPGVGPSRVVPRGHVAPGYDRRGYAGRPVDPAYGVRPGYGTRPGYAGRPGYGYAGPRSYAVPRGYVAPRAYPYGRGYYAPGYYYGAPRYVAPGWRGPWGYAVVSPRFSTGYWQPYYYRPSIGIGLYYGADGLYPFGAVPAAYYDPAPGVVYGGLRITDAPRDAQVFVDGNYVGIVDDFDGAFQHLNLEAGRHRVELHAPGLTPIAFDVDVVPGETITLRAEIG